MMRGIMFRLVALALFALFLTAGGYIVYQAGAAQGGGAGAGISLSPLVLLCGSGLLLLAGLGTLMFGFCPRRWREEAWGRTGEEGSAYE